MDTVLAKFFGAYRLSRPVNISVRTQSDPICSQPCRTSRQVPTRKANPVPIQATARRAAARRWRRTPMAPHTDGAAHRWPRGRVRGAIVLNLPATVEPRAEPGRSLARNREKTVVSEFALFVQFESPQSLTPWTQRLHLALRGVNFAHFTQPLKTSSYFYCCLTGCERELEGFLT